MNKKNDFQTSNAELVTISRAEYEKLQAQSNRVSELESRVELLMESSAPGTVQAVRSILREE